MKQKETLKEQMERLNSLELKVDDCLKLGLIGIAQFAGASGIFDGILRNTVTQHGVRYNVEVDYKVTISKSTTN